MSSTLRVESSRAAGPVTPEGKARSSQNALRHGMRAESLVLETESADDFAAHLARLHDELKPEPGVELQLVRTMAVASWRQMRLWEMEKMQFESPVAREESRYGSDAGATPADRIAGAFQFLCHETTILEKLNRYEAHYDRQYRRALELLNAYRDRKSKTANTVFTGRTEPNLG